MFRALLDTMLREWRQLTSRPLYMCTFVLVPMAACLALTYEMSSGLPQKVPVAVVDLDNSNMSRKITRELSNQQMLNVTTVTGDKHDADEAIKRGEIFGYFVIPADFSREVFSMRQPELTYYANYMFLVPASLAYRSFKTQSILASGAVITTSLASVGVDSKVAMAKLQPYSAHYHLIGNPYTNYGIYLNNSFVPGVLALIILLMTVYTITHEIKAGTSEDWLATARGSMLTALTGKLLPHTLIFTAVGLAIQAIMYGFCGYPINCGVWRMVLAMLLMVMATQAFAAFFSCVVPNMRLALSAASIVGILTFSVAGFSMPVESMYAPIGVFSYVVPMRYYFLIYVDQALNGLPLYYSRVYYAALLAFLLLPLPLIGRLRRACVKFAYIP